MTLPTESHTVVTAKANRRQRKERDAWLLSESDAALFIQKPRGTSVLYIPIGACPPPIIGADIKKLWLNIAGKDMIMLKSVIRLFFGHSSKNEINLLKSPIKLHFALAYLINIAIIYSMQIEHWHWSYILLIGG